MVVDSFVGHIYFDFLGRMVGAFFVGQVFLLVLFAGWLVFILLAG